MATDNPGKTFLPIPDGAVSYCSGPSGDCIYLLPVEELTLGRTGQLVPGETVPPLKMGDTGRTFEVEVRPHEIEKLSEAWLKRIVAEHGIAAVQAIIDNDPAAERLERNVYLMIVEDVEQSDASLGRRGWRELLLPVQATQPADFSGGTG